MPLHRCVGVVGQAENLHGIVGFNIGDARQAPQRLKSRSRLVGRNPNNGNAQLLNLINHLDVQASPSLGEHLRIMSGLELDEKFNG